MKDAQKIAQLVKELREEKGMSRAELAQTTLMSIENIICIEENIIQPAVATLYKIARALRVPAGTFIDEEPESNSHSTESTIAYRFTAAEITCKELDYKLLASEIGERKIQPCLIEIAPKEEISGGLISYKGDAFIYVLEGDAIVTYGNEYYELAKGDSFYFDTATPHTIHANGEKIAKILIALSPIV